MYEYYSIVICFVVIMVSVYMIHMIPYDQFTHFLQD